jgi:V8-like Glu-specific endopeptidase
MNAAEEKNRSIRPQPLEDFESPFLDQELFTGQGEEEWAPHLGVLEVENEFRLAFEGFAQEGVERSVPPKGTDWERIEYEIIGTNDMDAVANSLTVPYRWICRLDIDYDITPFGTSRRLTGTGRGTGTLISPCHVLTAAHNLITYDPVGRNTLRATRIRVTPAHDGSSSPPVAMMEADLSQSSVHRLWDITRRYDSTGAVNNAGEVETNRYDYALLRLRTAIGDSQVAALGGPLGYWGNQGSGGAARFQRVEPVVLRRNTVFVAGYGSDDCVRAARTASSNRNIRLGSQLTATGQITLVREGTGTQYVGRSMAHDVDTCGGQSGAPVWLELNGIYYLVGVHTAAINLIVSDPNDPTKQITRRRNQAVRVTMEVTNQVRDWMTRAPCPGAAHEMEDDGSLAGERLALEEEDLAPDGVGEEPSQWAMEWAGDEGESAPTPPLNPPWDSANAEEPEGEAALEHDTPPVTQAISDAVDQKDWPRVLELAIRVGWHDENQLTNLLFFSRHTELGRRKLDPKKNKEDQKLAQEWSQILVKEVRPAIQKAAEDRNLEVSGHFVAERDPQLSGEKGGKFKEVVARAAKEVDMDPGFLAAVLLAEWDQASLYLSTGEVWSFDTGTDNFFAQREQLRANVPAFAQVRFDERKKTTNINEHGNRVTTIPYKTGRDAALATAVYLKNGEIKLRRAAQKNGGDFDRLPVATRFVLVRIAMAAGHGGISPDGDLIRFKKKGGRWVMVKPGETGGILLGVAPSLDRVLKGEDILVRNWEPRKDPTNDSHVTHRNATILASQAMHLGDWFFRAQPLSVQPELETFEDFDQEVEGFYEDSGDELIEAPELSDEEDYAETDIGLDEGDNLDGEEENGFGPAAEQIMEEYWEEIDENEMLGSDTLTDQEDQEILSEEIARLLPPRIYLSETSQETVAYETPPLPKGVHRFEHWFLPMKRDSATNKWIPDGDEKILEPIDPGFFDASGALELSSLNGALKELLTGKPEFSRHLSRDALRDGRAKPGDSLRVALVDVTGKKLLDPEYAGWGSTVPVVGASCPKVAALYAAFQLRQDLKHVAAAEKITKTADLIRTMKERWKREGILDPPKLDQYLYPYTNPPALEFSADVDSAIDNIIHRENSGHAARTLIKVIGFPYIASLLWQSGLRHPKYGGLWLTSSYDGGAPWSSPSKPPPTPVYGHNATALSLATFFTLLAQDRLVTTGLPRTMKTALSTASWFSSTLPSASIASKVGLLLRCLKRGPKLKNGQPVLDKNNQPVMGCKQSEATHVHEAGFIENGHFRYAVAIMTTGIPTGVSLLQKLIAELDTLIRNNNP